LVGTIDQVHTHNKILNTAMQDRNAHQATVLWCSPPLEEEEDDDDDDDIFLAVLNGWEDSKAAAENIMVVVSE
jgi:hypothetical protein